MINWLNIFKHLLPLAQAWSIIVDKTLRRFFEGLTGVGADTKTFHDGIFEDIDPQKTRELAEWENQFALASTGLTEQERRDRLEATWKALGGQSPRYIQDTLQAAGFDVYVHEWWEPIPDRPNGGSIDGDVVPVARIPFDYLDDGTGGVQFLMVDGAADAQDGDAISQDGSTSVPVGYPLVNKILETFSDLIGDGAPEMQDGGEQAQDGGLIGGFKQKQYAIPADPTKYPYFLYVGAQTFPDQAMLPQSRREEFETLCLKICPTEQWLGILVSYS
jgi:hypothetical protein